jgi:hypothetical protein
MSGSTTNPEDTTMPALPQKSIRPQIAAATATLLMTAFATGALARPLISITNDGFSPSPIRIVSENGTSWTKIKQDRIDLPVRVHIVGESYVIRRYDVRQSGQPDGEHVASQPYSSPYPASVDRTAMYTGSTEHLTAAEREKLIAACNANLKTGKGINETHNLLNLIGIELVAHLMETGYGAPLDASGLGAGSKGFGTMPVPVICEGKPARPNDVAAKEPNFAVKDLHLRFMTTAGYQTSPNPGTRCKLTRAKVRVGTSKAGGVKFRLWTKVGSEPAQSQFVETWSGFVGPGKFEASFMKAIPVTKTTLVQAMVEDLTNPIGQSTGWKSVTVRCTGAGGGGLADAPTSSNPDGRQPVKPLRPVIGTAVPKPTAVPSGRPIIGTAIPKPTAVPPPSRVPHARPMGPQIKTAPVPVGSPVAAKDRFDRSKPRVN